ncbi:MAG: TIGR03790 family protein, partial [Acidobacteria bacterium]|nr:TIGR03790 family protein [Acidobacteriota bacterium]
MHLHPATLLAAAVASFLLSAASASPSVPEPSEVLVVSNRAHPWSGDVADAYLHARQIPAEQVVVIDLPPTPLVSREVYQQRIEGPVARWLRTHDAFDRIRFIVLVPGVPLRVTGTRGRQGSTASVDSELALLYRRMTGTPVASTGFIENPYFSAGALDAPRPFDHQHYDIYLVTRLDGRTAADATALISRGAIRPTRFSVVVDGRPRAASGAEATWLAEVPARVQAAQPAARVLADESAAPIAGEVEVTGYASWGSNDVQARVPPVSFGAGAIASSFMSSDARTLESPPPGWVPGTWERPGSFFAGSPEALAADWLQAGLTGLGAQVTEPYLDGAFRPATLQEAWVRGYTLAESFYLALPYLSWQAVVFGDPLARGTDGPAPAAEVPTAGDTSGVTPFVARSAA